MTEPELIWEDREIRFDSRSNLLSCRQGEKVVDSINSVEDTKGNNGERGSLVVTNLRIIWVREYSSSHSLLFVSHMWNLHSNMNIYSCGYMDECCSNRYVTAMCGSICQLD